MALSRKEFGKKAALLFLAICLFPYRAISRVRKTRSNKNRNHAGRTGESRKAAASSVAVLHCDTYDPKRIYKELKKGLEAIHFPVPVRKRILIKPNILAQNKPEQGATTHPAVVDAVCRVLWEHGCVITI